MGVDLDLSTMNNVIEKNILYRFLLRGFTEDEKPVIGLLEPEIKRETHYDPVSNKLLKLDKIRSNLCLLYK